MRRRLKRGRLELSQYGCVISCLGMLVQIWKLKLTRSTLQNFIANCEVVDAPEPEPLSYKGLFGLVFSRKRQTRRVKMRASQQILNLRAILMCSL